MSGFYIRALDAREKESRLLESCTAISNEDLNGSVFVVRNEDLECIPGKPLAYWCAASFFRLFQNTESFANQSRGAFVGLQTSDDFRFARLNWEVNSESYNRKWFPFAKGGEYLPYYSDIHLCVNWSNSGYEIKNFRNKNGKLLSRPQNVDHYLKPGITWPERTTSGFCPQVLPEGAIFSQVGLAMFAPTKEEMLGWILALHTRIYQYVVELLIGLGEETVSGSAGRHYTSGMISKFPYLKVDNEEILKEFQNLYSINSFAYVFEENSEIFDPQYFFGKRSIADISNEIEGDRDLLLDSALNSSKHVEREIRAQLGIQDADLSDVFNVVGQHPVLDLQNDELLASSAITQCSNLSTDKIIDKAVERGIVGRAVTKKSFFVDRDIEVLSIAYGVNAQSIRIANKKAGFPFKLIDHKGLALRVLSYLIGCAFGRFDPKSNQGKAEPNVYAERNPFLHIANLSVFQSMFSSHGDDCNLSKRVLDIAELCCGDDGLLLNDISATLDGVSISRILNNPNDFFSFHLAQYSKSRRQAPIYWPLHTPSASYTIWIYYHRLNGQTLYTCVNDFVEPKLKEVGRELNDLRAKSSRNRQEEKTLALLTDFQAELKDFRDELLRIAKFWKPNLNDGVQIVAAPLWKFFQHKAWQKKLKETWEKLEKGDYDWAHLACSIWPERVLRKSHQDRSLAIANDVEDAFWHEVEVPVMRGKKATGKTKLEWQPKDLTDDELNALIQAKIKEMRA